MKNAEVESDWEVKFSYLQNIVAIRYTEEAVILAALRIVNYINEYEIIPFLFDDR